VYKIPTSIVERHERDEIAPLDLQHPFDGVGLKFSIHVRTCFAIRACFSNRNGIVTTLLIREKNNKGSARENAPMRDRGVKRCSKGEVIPCTCRKVRSWL
jgi:hypothetical protein